MALTDLPIKPGMYTDDTPRDVGKLGYWKSGDKVRFYDGLPMKLGGWTRGADDATFLGVARGSCDWRTYRSEVFLAFGTQVKAYVWAGGTYYDITPIRATSVAGAVTFAASNGSTELVVTHNNHGALEGDFVIFSDATSLGGTVTAAVLNDEYQITSITSANVYTVTLAVAANASDTGNGGAAVVGEYQIHVGQENSIAGLGWGAGNYGELTWGTPRTVTDFLAMARTWTLDQWGEDVILNPRQGGVYVWDSSAGTSYRAAVIAAAPATAKAILVSPEDRHLIALGAHDGSADNAMLIRWCDQENYTDWTPTVTNTAGSKQLDMGNEILVGAKVRGEHLIFTDSSMYAMAYVGPPDTFGFRTLGDHGGLVGPLAVHVFEGVAYWMGDRDFFMYDGVTKVIPCTVNSAVFDDLNRDQKVKVYCGVNREFREVWWLYPSADSDACDSYAIYNIKDQTWAYGTLARSMLIGDSEVFKYAYGFGQDGYIYTHESGTDDYDQAMTAYIESGGIEIDAGGNQFAHISKVIPDLKGASGTVNVTIKGKRYPQATEEQTSGPHAVTPTTQFINPRLRCRQIAVRWESSTLGAAWQLGTMRVDLIPHGGR